MGSGTSDWKKELDRFLEPFLDRLGHKARRRMCPLYVSGLIGPGDRKSVQPMAERFAFGGYDQLHHFIAAGVWDSGPVETELLVQADRLVGGSDAVLVIDDTAIAKKGTHSVGVAAQYASALGKTANCQTLVSLTLARGEVPVMLALRLFLPESWTSSGARLDRAGVPDEYRTARTKPADSDEFGRGFRAKPATDSDLNRPGVPMIPATSVALLSCRRGHLVRRGADRQASVVLRRLCACFRP
jgi:SRSO17 transposase